MDIFKELGSYFEPTKVELKVGSVLVDSKGKEQTILKVSQDKVLINGPKGLKIRYLDNLECLIRSGYLALK